MTCRMCGGKEFLQAAPVSALPDRPAGRFYRRPLWSKAIVVPCWECRRAADSGD